MWTLCAGGHHQWSHHQRLIRRDALRLERPDPGFSACMVKHRHETGQRWGAQGCSPPWDPRGSMNRGGCRVPGLSVAMAFCTPLHTLHPHSYCQGPGSLANLAFVTNSQHHWAEMSSMSRELVNTVLPQGGNENRPVGTYSRGCLKPRISPLAALGLLSSGQTT